MLAVHGWRPQPLVPAGAGVGLATSSGHGHVADAGQSTPNIALQGSYPSLSL